MNRRDFPFWPLAGYQLFYFAFIGIFSPYFPLYLDAIGWSAASIAALMVVMQGARVVAPTLWSLWAGSRFDRMRQVVRWAPLAAAGGFSLFYFSEEVALSLTAVGVVAFFWSGALPLFEAMTLAHLGREVRRYPLVRLWGSIGFITAVVGIGIWLEVMPIATLRHWIIAVLLLLALCGWTLPLPEWEHPAATGVGRARFAWWREPQIVWFLLAASLMSVAHGALYTFFSLHLTLLGYSKTMVGFLWALGVVAEIVLFFFLPRLTARWGVRWPFVATFAIAAGRFLLIGWWADALLWVVVAQTLHAVTFALYHGCAVQLINAWFGARAPALGQALYSSLSFGLGGMVGSALAGWVWTAAGPGWTFTASAGAALVGLFAATQSALRAPRFATQRDGVE